MQFIRVHSIQGEQMFAIFEISREEYARIMRERNERAERDSQNEIDRERERQWYQVETQQEF